MFCYLTGFTFWDSLLRVSGELAPSSLSSTESSSFLGGLSVERFEPRKAAAFLAAAFDLLLVMVVCADTLGALTTNDESDLSFLRTGNITEGTASGAFTFLLLRGNIFALTSCKVWSGLNKASIDAKV